MSDNPVKMEDESESDKVGVKFHKAKVFKQKNVRKRNVSNSSDESNELSNVTEDTL